MCIYICYLFLIILLFHHILILSTPTCSVYLHYSMNNFTYKYSLSLSFFFFFNISSCFNTQMLILPLKTLKPPPHKLPFRHNVTLTVALAVGTPPQNATMVLDTGSELSWLRCNTSTRPAFNPTLSSSYSPINCSSPTCTTQTQNFSVPPSCDAYNHCHAVLSYADASSSEGSLAVDTFGMGGSDVPDVVFGCMDTGFSSNPDEDSNTTGLMGMNRGSLSFVSQMNFSKFSYCISDSDLSGVLLLGNNNFTWLMQLNYTPLIQISTPLPYFDRTAYTVQLEGIMIGQKLLPLPKSILEPDHTGAGQTMVDSGTQFTFLLGPAYDAFKNELLNQTNRMLRVLDDPNFVFQGAMDLCYLIPKNQTKLPRLPTVILLFRGAEMSISGDRLLYRVRGEDRGSDSVYCLTIGNSDLLGIEAYLIGNHHQQNVWMEFDLERSRIGLAQVKCDLVGQKFGVYQ